MKVFLVFFFIVNSASAYQVKVEAEAKGDLKVFKAIATNIFNASKDDVIKGIINFDDKCNNQRRSKRKVMKWEKNCSFHNENLVEAVKIKEYRKGLIEEKYQGTLFLLWRNIYNSGKYSHYDVIRRNDNENETIISHTMLKPKEVKDIINDPVRTVSAFTHLKGTYKIKKLNDERTQVEYLYESETDHWFLKRDILESKVKSNIEKGTLLALKSIEESLKK